MIPRKWLVAVRSPADGGRDVVHVFPNRDAMAVHMASESLTPGVWRLIADATAEAEGEEGGPLGQVYTHGF